MPTKIEKDIVSGRDTTGHEWDGIKELNTPLPKWWLYVLYATMVWAAVYVVLYPSVPGITGYFHGILGYSQRNAVDDAVRAVATQRAGTMDRIKVLSFAEIRREPELMAAANTAGRIAFANNCQPCHAAGGGGQPGYPALAAGAWIWGGTLGDIQQTIVYGIRSGDPKARESQMPRFGADGVLKPDEIQAVADYVMTLYGRPMGVDVAPGRRLFAENCAVCHGDAGQGDREKGAPRLASRVHLYGDDRATVVAQITAPRMGVMPAWHARLDEATVKSLTLYVHALGGGE
ncbi:MAG: cytochrome-c oxidase, cbb3-type subunit III [Acetobacteraceae bacterium]